MTNINPCFLKTTKYLCKYSFSTGGPDLYGYNYSTQYFDIYGTSFSTLSGDMFRRSYILENKNFGDIAHSVIVYLFFVSYKSYLDY